MTGIASSRLDSLASRLSVTAKPGVTVLSVPLDAISPNPRQPRKTFDEAHLEQLAASIRRHGIIQPLIVTASAVAGQYELVAGERRWRAARIAGLRDVPVLVRDAKQINNLVVALVENLDRDDMTPIDEAQGVAELVAETSVQEAAETLGRSKQWISKRARIAKAPGFVQEFVASGAVRDVEALYELAKLAEDNPEEAKLAIANYTPGAHLREQLKAAQRPADETVAPTDNSEPESPPARPTVEGDHAPSLKPRPTPGKGSVSHAKPAGSDPKPMKVEAILRRGGDLFLVTPDGQIRVKFSAKAKQQLGKLLDEG